MLLAFVAIGSANARIPLGVKGGINMSEFSVKGNVLDKSNNIGFYLGPTAKVSAPARASASTPSLSPYLQPVFCRCYRRTWQQSKICPRPGYAHCASGLPCLSTCVME